ncbi:uncharacterized protein RAG0_00608 [Rhynchosporium agropyri]|uniref:Uncharacterized protein n=2 Tax=Rhynchosporium TaxID=38037 RepID=A0A1E1M8M6_RHYSE|nr:uncharacterized protein RAG0_00608 [Rhynchosporium agropyri]CZT45434.1 uncharacterized protein RSE6_05741 [Rhynchosporium secalis]
MVSVLLFLSGNLFLILVSRVIELGNRDSHTSETEIVYLAENNNSLP